MRPVRGTPAQRFQAGMDSRKLSHRLDIISPNGHTELRGGVRLIIDSFLPAFPIWNTSATVLTGSCHKGDGSMAKKSRGGRMTAAKKRAAKSPGGKGPVKKRKVGRKIMKT